MASPRVVPVTDEAAAGPAPAPPSAAASRAAWHTLLQTLGAPRQEKTLLRRFQSDATMPDFDEKTTTRENVHIDEFLALVKELAPDGCDGAAASEDVPASEAIAALEAAMKSVESHKARKRFWKKVGGGDAESEKAKAHYKAITKWAKEQLKDVKKHLAEKSSAPWLDHFGSARTLDSMIGIRDLPREFIATRHSTRRLAAGHGGFLAGARR